MDKEVYDMDHYFMDYVKLTGFKECHKNDDAVREYAASLMITSGKHKRGPTSKLICFYDDLVFEPPLPLNSEFHLKNIPYKDIIGFYVAPTYNTRLILVVQEDTTETIFLCGIQMSTADKAKEISALLGEARPPQRQSSTTRDDTSKSNFPLSINNEIAAQNIDEIDLTNSQKTATLVMDDTQINAKVEPSYDKILDTKKKHDHSDFNSHTLRNNDRRFGSRSFADSDVFDGYITPFLPETADHSNFISIGYYNDEDDVNEQDEDHRQNKEKDCDDQRASPENAWVENITYISNTPNESGQITTNGSVYMYVAQQVNPRLI